MKKSIHFSLLALAVTAICSVNASAQTPTCADVVWSPALLENNPTIAKHCLELIERGGEWYAVVQAKVIRHGANSTVVRFREPDGSWSSTERTYPPRGFAAEIVGQQVLISQAAEGQELNVYASSQGGENFTIPMLDAAAIELGVKGLIEEEIVEEAIAKEVEAEIIEEEMVEKENGEEK